MLSFFKIGTIVSFLVCVVSLVILILKTFTFGKNSFYAEAQGSVKKGIIYAFGRGMMPWEKESVKKHLPTYIGGILYHTGIFAAFIYLFLFMSSFEISKTFLFIFRFFFVIGFLSGSILLIKRTVLPTMRKISCPDDFIANIIVEFFLISACVKTFSVSSAHIFLLCAILMFLYIPIGKIRHCVFFFYVRILFGVFFGRRNILPKKTHKVQA